MQELSLPSKTDLNNSQFAEKRSANKIAAFAGWLTAVFAAFAVIGVSRHELWRDEAQAWCIALHSGSITELFYNLRYEMHPALWHLILFTITRFTHNPLFMQLVHVGIISGAVYLFARFSPFSKVQKALFAFSYFPFYEYGVISRSYSIVMLLLFALCTVWPKRAQLYLPLFGILSVLANTNAYGFLLSAPLAATLLIDLVVEQWKPAAKDRSTNSSAPSRKRIVTTFAAGACVYACACGLALLQLIPPADGCFGENSKPLTVQESRLNKAIGTVWASYVPIPDLTTYHSWNTNVISPTGWAPTLTVPLSIGLLLLSASLFLRQRIVLFLYTAGSGILIAFAYAKLIGGVRQQGHLFELLIIGLWLSAYYGEAPVWGPVSKLIPGKKTAAAVFTTLLVIQVAAGIYSYVADLRGPFSASALVANYLKKNHLEDKLIIGTNDHEVIPISALIDRRIYYPESETFGSFVRNDSHRHTLSFDETFRRAKKLMIDRQQSEAILITNYPLGGFPKDMKMDVLKLFDKAIQPDEVFYVYSMSLPDIKQTKASQR